MIIGRIESLVLKKGMDDALARARAYIAAGADGIRFVSSKEKTADEILEFCRPLRRIRQPRPAGRGPDKL